MADFDVMLTPSARGVAPCGRSGVQPAVVLLGTPCVNVPGLFDDDGLPLGIHIVGRFGRDRVAQDIMRMRPTSGVP